MRIRAASIGGFEKLAVFIRQEQTDEFFKLDDLFLTGESLTFRTNDLKSCRLDFDVSFPPFLRDDLLRVRFGIGG